MLVCTKTIKLRAQKCRQCSGLPTRTRVGMKMFCFFISRTFLLTIYYHIRKIASHFAFAKVKIVRMFYENIFVLSLTFELNNSE